MARGRLKAAAAAVLVVLHSPSPIHSQSHYFFYSFISIQIRSSLNVLHVTCIVFSILF